MPDRLRLACGLPLLVLPKRDLPLVRVHLSILHGCASDPADRPGAAYVTAAMVDEGAGGRTAVQIAEDLLDIGTSLSTFVDADSTTFCLQVLEPELELALDVLADVMRRPHFDPVEFARVGKELENRSLEQLSDPGTLASQAFSAAVFGRHPYGRPVLPRRDDLRRLELKHLIEFHARHYGPDSAVMVVAGDVEPPRLRRSLERRFGRWRGGRRRRPAHPAPPTRGPRLVVVDRPESEEAVIRVGHLAPRRRTLEYPGLEILNTIVGGSFTSRLNRNLREIHGYTYGASSSFALMRHGGRFVIHTAVDLEFTVPALVEIFRELREIRRRKVDFPELAKAAHLVVEELPDQVETLSGLAAAFSEIAMYGLSMQSLARLPPAVAALTPGELLKIARRRLSPADATIVVVGAARRIEAGLKKEFGEVQIARSPLPRRQNS